MSSSWVRSAAAGTAQLGRNEEAEKRQPQGHKGVWVKPPRSALAVRSWACGVAVIQRLVTDAGCPAL